MEVRRLEEKEVAVATLSEDLRFHTAQGLDEICADILSKGDLHLIVDFQHVNHVDSTGIGVLVKHLHKAGEVGRRFILTSLNSNLRRVFRVSNLHRVFDIYRDPDEALFTLEEHKVLLWVPSESEIEFYDELLTANGFVTEVVKDLKSATAGLESGDVSVLLLDVLENEDAKYELARLNQTRREGPVPLVVISTYLEEERAYGKLGMDLFVSKPFRVDDLAASLKEIVQARNQ